ncbi:transcriptional regulator with XRE-family HTH domain [Streptomyces achromogenes]|nr:transcriptional regulator with XRE-family HTH domain [Streptomyces achromogenes]
MKGATGAEGPVVSPYAGATPEPAQDGVREKGWGMSRWKALPEALDPQVRRLVVQLRQVKDHSGLSLAALASRTSYSRSSWERYLNGKATPPRHAVEMMAQVCGGDLIGLTALWEVAASAPTAEPPPPGPHHSVDASEESRPAPEPVPGRGRERVREPRDGLEEESEKRSAAGPRAPRPVSAETASALRPSRPRRGPSGRSPMVAAVVVVAVAALSAAWSWTSSAQPDSGESKAAITHVPTSSYSAKTFPCHFTVLDGRLYAGHSTTLTDQYGVGATVEAVAEVQCLVQRHGFDPKGIDGSFGPNTKAAVQGFQRSRGLDADGIVGPMTWRELRKPGG